MRRTAAALTAVAGVLVLSVAACAGGGGSASPSSSASSPTTSSSPPSPTPSPSHSAQPGEPALIAVPGYDYADPPGDVASEAQQVVSAEPGILDSASAHAVLHNGKLVAAIMLVQVNPRYADLPVLQQNIVPAMAEGMAGEGEHVTTETIHTEKVVVAESATEVVYAWYHNGEITAAVGSSESNGQHDVRDFVDAYLQTAHAVQARGGG